MIRGLVFFLFWIFLSLSGVAQTTKPPISKNINPDGWIIRTKSSAYQIVIGADGTVKPVFYGDAVQNEYQRKNALWTESIDEVPVRGAYPFKTPALEVVYSDLMRDTELKFVKGEIIEIDNRPVLKITHKDKYYPLQVVSFIRVIAEFDILEKWIEVSNTGKRGDIKVENLMSGSIVLPADEYVLTQLAGKQMNEFQLYESSLAPGTKLIQNKAFKSNANAPWFQVRPQSSNNQEKGPTWFGSLHYSGNWELAFDKTFNGPLQVLGGINFWDSAISLKPGEIFVTPKLSVGFTQEGSEGVAQNLSAYVRKDVLPKEHRDELRPVLYNSWYTTTDKLNEEQQISLAKTASKLGVELFVIDAGWYKTNNKSYTGLGNWEVDSVKFPRGLTALIKNVNDLGMKFGIWVEPESVHTTSDIYKNHPDWVLRFPNREPKNRRVFLNLGKEEVYNHLLESLSKLLRENKIDFVKWDQNNYLAEPGWPDAPAAEQREVRIRYNENLYKLVAELRSRFPRVMFESCASGGGRTDLGMMSKMDQAWVSDNTTAVDRLFIQYGYLSAMPANTMVSWVIEKIANQKYQETSLSYKFDVAMAGVLGVGYDIRKWTAEEIELVKTKIEIYKKIRPMVQQGIVHRLVSPFNSNRSAIQYNSTDNKSVALFCYNMAKYVPGGQLEDRGTNVLKLKGLNPQQSYSVKNTENPKDKGNTYTGEFLMRIGINWPLTDSFQSSILLLNQVD